MSQPLRLTLRRWRLAALVPPLILVAPFRAAETRSPSDDIAIAIVFDTSGSMNESIPTRPGHPPDTKIRIAQRALGAVINRLEAFSRGPTAKPLKIGIYRFHGTEARIAQPMAKLDPGELRRWLGSVRAEGPTPLGATLFLAGKDLLATSAASRHILVLTDGANSSGPTPEKVLDQISQASGRKQTPVFTHIIALGIKPETFAALKRQGATLIGASDEAQLNTQFDFILEEKILVEAPR